MKMYRAIIRNTRYSEAYFTSQELFKTKKSLKQWFSLREEKHHNTFNEDVDTHSIFFTSFNEVLIGIEEVNIK